MISMVCFCIVLALPGYGQQSFLAAGQNAQPQASHDSDYQAGLRELDARRWDEAIASFSAAASRKGSLTDAALYWKAFAESRAGRREDAFATVAELRNGYPSSRWMGDARALEVEMRAKDGAPVSPGAEGDEELKLLAINSLMQSDPNAALPVLQKLLASSNTVKVKDRALFVLTQSSSPEAVKVLTDVARGASNQDLQAKAIRYIGMMGNDGSRQQLAGLYRSSADEKVKREILRAFMISGSKDFLLNAAKTEKDPDLQREAIRSLAVSGGQDQLWQLYQNGATSSEMKQAILQSLFVSGDSARLVEVARNEKDPRLRAAAIKSLGLMGHNGQGDVLVSIYKSDQSKEVRDQVLNALFLQQDGKGLVDLARNEKDPHWKEAIVQKMSLIHSKETNDYMMELLK